MVSGVKMLLFQISSLITLRIDVLLVIIAQLQHGDLIHVKQEPMQMIL